MSQDEAPQAYGFERDVMRAGRHGGFVAKRRAELVAGFVAAHDRAQGFNPRIGVYLQIDAARKLAHEQALTREEKRADAARTE